MISEAFLEELANRIEFEFGPLAVVEAYEQLVAAVASGDMELIVSVARDSLLVVAEDWRLRRVIEETNRAWDERDDELATRARRDMNDETLLGLEYLVLRRAGLTQAAATSLLISLSDETQVDAVPMTASAVSEETRVLAEELIQELTIQAIRDERVGGLLRRIGMAVHVVGGSVLMLADVGAATAILTANPLAVVPAQGLALVSLRMGRNLVRTGLQGPQS